MSYTKRVANVLLTAIMVFSTAGTAYAQATTPKANGYRISPLRTELTIEKGTSQTATVSIENPSKVPFKVKGVINDFEASDSENGQPGLLLDGSYAPSHSLKRFVSDPAEVDLAPNERKEVKVVISIPSNAAAGGYYGAIRFLPVETVAGANVSLAASVGSLFLVNVPGNINEHLQLLQFGAASNGSIKKVITGGPVSIITRFKNDGDTHEKPFGKIQVKDSKGKVVAEEEINNVEPKSNVLPASIRKFETKLKNSKWFGYYTVTAGYGYNPSNGELITAKASFWYVPFWVLALVIIFILAVLGAIYMIYRKIQKSRTKRTRS
ncbi:MAG: hypothetical protein JWO47_240 [Candidatus Saccharibacteria bacterium]|nr:hypothetical protein [Candidatus Saccharibacteria bacterium]